MNKRHEITGVKFDGENLTINIDGKDHSFDLKVVSQRLLKASDVERSNFVISPSGYGIHWPLVDEDLSIDALLGIIHKPGINKAA